MSTCKYSATLPSCLFLIKCKGGYFLINLKAVYFVTKKGIKTKGPAGGYQDKRYQDKKVIPRGPNHRTAAMFVDIRPAQPPRPQHPAGKLAPLPGRHSEGRAFALP